MHTLPNANASSPQLETRAPRAVDRVEIVEVARCAMQLCMYIDVHARARAHMDKWTYTGGPVPVPPPVHSSRGAVTQEYGFTEATRCGLCRVCTVGEIASRQHFGLRHERRATPLETRRTHPTQRQCHRAQTQQRRKVLKGSIGRKKIAPVESESLRPWPLRTSF